MWVREDLAGGKLRRCARPPSAAAAGLASDTPVPGIAGSARLERAPHASCPLATQVALAQGFDRAGGTVPLNKSIWRRTAQAELPGDVLHRLTSVDPDSGGAGRGLPPRGGKPPSRQGRLRRHRPTSTDPAATFGTKFSHLRQRKQSDFIIAALSHLIRQSQDVVLRLLSHQLRQHDTQLIPPACAFKIGGYTQRGGEGWQSYIPLSGMVLTLFTNTGSSVPADQITPHDDSNNNFALDQISAFLGGGIGEHTGGFWNNSPTRIFPTRRTSTTPICGHTRRHSISAGVSCELERL